MSDKHDEDVRNSYTLKVPVIASPYVVTWGKALLMTVKDKGYKMGDFVTLEAENGETVTKEIFNIIRGPAYGCIREGYSCNLDREYRIDRIR